MSRMILSFSLATTLMGTVALGEVPKVAVDIAPVHSLVARIMEGAGKPNLIVQAGASPHEYSLRPSEAKALQDADLVFWVSAGLTPWLPGALASLAGDATIVELPEVEGTIRLEVREGALFEGHTEDAHGDEGEHTENEEDHAEEAKERADGEYDPHVWLSPENAGVWLDAIAVTLSTADPENANVYQTNAEAARAELDALSADVNAILDPVRGGRFIVFHDAYQHFEVSFDFPASGAISISDASDPSPARIAGIQTRVSGEGIECVLAEPQFNSGLVATVLDGTEARTGILDPLGSGLMPGPALYPQLMRNLATALAECL